MKDYIEKVLNVHMQEEKRSFLLIIPDITGLINRTLDSREQTSFCFQQEFGNPLCLSTTLPIFRSPFRLSHHKQ